jgi:hypothetical protein
MPPFLSNSTSSTSKVATKMSLRSIGRMGQSMSAMMPNRQQQKDEDEEEEEEEAKEEQTLDHTPLPTINIPKQLYEQQENNLLQDILQVRHAMDLFLNSHISEAEKILEPKRYSTLYHSLGNSFVLFLKSMMTFQHTDIEQAIHALKETIQLADALRKRESSWLGNITSWVKGISVNDVWNMSRLHRHAVKW